MNFTFGIITTGYNDDILFKVVDSIKTMNNLLVQNYEIIIVGNTNIVVDKNIPFDDNVRHGWITKKKNLITTNSKYENIVFLHDYIIFDDNWYSGQCIAGNDFDVRMNRIINYDGSRFRDWCLWVHNNHPIDSIVGKDALLPYNINLSKYMYISGSYWICKKHIMEEYPLNENLNWGQGEDVEWSLKVRQHYIFNMNSNSIVYIGKPGKDRVFNEIGEDKLRNILENYA